jgi:xylulokinase
MDLGIDLGTSSVKTVLVDETGALAAEASAPLSVSRPKPLWSEQDPAAWVQAAQAAVNALPASLRQDVRSVGLSGQMHGAVILDERDAPLRPAILWNDGRSSAACVELEAALPDLPAITGNRAMPGFTAPKLAWLRRHEPAQFARTRRVLLPKDYLRLWLTGAAVSDVSDAAGTLWLDVGKRDWSDALLGATGLSRAHMPRLVEGNAVSGRLTPSAAAALGVPQAPVAGGAGDNAASGVGVGVISAGQAFLSLGTSGVIFAADAGFTPDPARGVHTFCHALPNTWHRMAVILSAASAIDSVAKMAGFATTPEAVGALGPTKADDPFFAPWLSGERTPHNNPHLRGGFIGLTHDTSRDALMRAALEGVAFALADGLEALSSSGLKELTVVGGGARIRAWAPVLAAALGLTLHYRGGGEHAAALGAARLGRLCVTAEAPEAVCTAGPLIRAIEPDRAIVAAQAPRRALWRNLHTQLSPVFAEFPS